MSLYNIVEGINFIGGLHVILVIIPLFGPHFACFVRPILLLFSAMIRSVKSHILAFLSSFVKGPRLFGEFLVYLSL